MILERGFEGLRELGTEKVALDALIENAEDLESRWEDIGVSGYRSVPVRLTEDQKCSFTGRSGEAETVDLTDYTFGQLCQKAGVPAAYIKKCYDGNFNGLAVENFERWAGKRANEPVRMKLRLFDGNLHAALTESYHTFEHPEILYGVQRAVGRSGRYLANEAYLSSDRMHIRFVDFDHPLKVMRDKLYSGFTVSSSNIGNGAFSIKYFLYRFACKNGMVRVQNGGTLFRQTHLKEFLEDSESLFSLAIDKMHDLDEIAETQIGTAMDRNLTAQELSFYLDKAKRELHLGKNGQMDVAGMIGTVYDQTLWGFVNSITDLSKRYTLDTRLEMEQWAGNMLAAA